MFWQIFKATIGELLGQSGTCYICNEKSVMEYKHSCGHVFHTKCITDWILHSPGEDISESKLQCPICRKKIDFKPKIPRDIRKVYFNLNEIQWKYRNSRYKVCERCLKPFLKENNGCEGSDYIPETRCLKCNPKPIHRPVIKCPGCGFGFEHIYGCPDFACCRYGFDQCKRNGSSCNHGSTESFQLCGHRWTISPGLYRQIMATRNNNTLFQENVSLPICSPPRNIPVGVTENVTRRLSNARIVAISCLHESICLPGV